MAWGDEPRYRSDLARERSAHRRTQDKLLEAEKRIAVLEAAAGFVVKCESCAKPLTKPGVLRLRIGVPDENGKFEGVKEHLCDKCDEGG